MKKKGIFILAVIITAAIVAVMIMGEKMIVVETENNNQKLEKTIVSEKKSEAELPASNALGEKIKAIKANSIQDEFKKCFKKEIRSENLDSLKTTLLQQKDFSHPSLNEENYELVTSDDKNLVVQFIPMEENKNKVRVFLISPEDGLPDRIKEFPESGAEPALRLKGALTLGTLKSKTTSTTQSSYDGSLLSIDLKNDKVVRIHLITNSSDFECKEESCQCLTKE